MNLRTYRTLQALILAGLGIFFLVRIGDGRILLYINQRFVFLILLGAIGLLAIAQVVMRSRPAPEPQDHDQQDHDHGDHSHDTRSGFALWVIALPLLVGVLLPARPLGSLAAATRGMNTNAPLSAGTTNQVNDLPSDQRTVLDWLRLFEQTSDLNTLTGQPADVAGFIYHDIRLEAGQFMVGRFSLTCCVADATAIGMVVDWPEAGKLPDNQWVRVRGPVETGQVEGKTVPLIRAQSVEMIPQPEQPYLFP